MNLNNLFENDNAKPGANYAEELAYQIFKVAPDLDATGVADEVLDYAFDLAVDDLGHRRAHSLFAYDQDFDSDLVSAYADLQRQDANKDMAEGWKGEFVGGTLGGIAGNLAGTAIAGPWGGIVGGAAGGAGGGIIGRELTKEEQLNEFAPLLAAGARLVITMAPKIAQVLKSTGQATARAAAPVAKSGAEIAAKNAGQIGLGLGAYEVGSSVAEIAKEITAKVGTALEEKTIMELAQVAFKFAIPAGIVLAILYGGKKVIDSLFSDSKEEQGVAESNSWDRLSGDTGNLDPEHLAYLKQQSEISRRTGLAVGDRVTLKDRPGFEGKIVHDWGGGDYTISGGGGGMKQSNNHRANARIIQKIQGVAEGVEIVDQDSDLDQQVYTLNVDGNKVSFTYWDYENNFQSPDIKDIFQQAQEQLGKKLSPEQVKAVARAVFKTFEQGVAEGLGGDLNEFAPPGSGDDDGGFDENTLKRMAAQWWQGDEDPRVEKTLAAAGWEIGQDEGYDNGGVFVVRAGDENGDTYTSWPAEELEGLSESYPKHQDLSGISTEKLKTYLAKQAKQSVPGEGAQVKRVKAELQRRKQGLAEASWHSEPEQERMDAIRQSRLNREREPRGSEAIDARIRARHDQLDQYNQSGRFWLKQKDTQEHISDAMIGKAAANAAAAEMLKQRPELQGNLVITAYGPGESQGVSEDMTRRGFLRGVGAAALAGAAGAASAGGYVPGQPNDWKYNMGVKKPGADAAPAASATPPVAGSEQTVDFFKAQSAASRAAAEEAANAAAKIRYTNPKFKEEYERIEKAYQQTKSIVLNNKVPRSSNPDLARRQYAESMKILIAADMEFARKTNALLKDYGALREADKKKEDEPEVRDVALQRAISRAKADFPAAGSGIEALAKDFMRSQDQDSKSFDQLRRAERKQDQMLGQIAKIDQEQGQEIQDLENQNSSLASRLQQLQNVNNDLEKKLAAMSGRRAEKTSKSADVSTTLAPVSTSTKAATPKATAKKKTADVEPTTSKAIGQIAKTLAPDASSLAFDRMSQELQPRQKELGFDEPVTIKPKKFDTSKASDAEYRELTSKIAKDIVSRPDAARAFNPNAMQGMSKQQEMPLENKDKPNKSARPEVDYDDPEWDAMVARVRKLAGEGPRKTVWDPVKRVYKTVPVNK